MVEPVVGLVLVTVPVQARIMVLGFGPAMGLVLDPAMAPGSADPAVLVLAEVLGLVSEDRPQAQLILPRR